MPRNATTGVFTRVSNSFSDAVLGTPIDPSDANALFDDQDSGLSGLFPGKPNGTIDPTNLDDSAAGYLRGSIWVNNSPGITSSIFSVCFNNAAGAAVWYNLGIFDPVAGNLKFGQGTGNVITTGVNNTLTGSVAGRALTTGNTNAFYGRAAGSAETTGSNNVGMGHGPLLTGVNNLSCIGIGNEAGGGAQNASEATIGFSGDSYCIAIGELAGKSTTAARANCIAIGKNVAIGDVDNVTFIGRTCTATQVSGRLTQSGLNRATEATAAGVTLSAAQIYTGFLARSGGVGAPFIDTTPTAAQILHAFTGAGATTIPIEAISFFWYCRNVTGQTQQLMGGGGVTISGTDTTADTVTATWLVRFTNTTTGSIACTFFRIDA